MAEDVIRAKQIELVDDQGETSCVLTGEAEGRVAIVLQGPAGPRASATIGVERENGRPAIYLLTEV